MKTTPYPLCVPVSAPFEGSRARYSYTYIDYQGQLQERPAVLALDLGLLELGTPSRPSKSHKEGVVAQLLRGCGRNANAWGTHT